MTTRGHLKRVFRAVLRESRVPRTRGARAGPKVPIPMCVDQRPDTERCRARRGRAAEARARAGARRAGARKEPADTLDAAGAHPGSAQALRPPDRRRAAADRRRGARARAAQGRGRRGGEAAPDRGQPPPRHVDHAELHEGRRPAARPDPGRESRPDPRGREVRLAHGLQALDLRDLVDPPGRDAGARRPGPHDPTSGARRRAGAPRDARTARPLAEAEPRADAARDRQGERLHGGEGPRPARADRGPDQPRDARRRRREHLRRPDRGRERRSAGGHDRRAHALDGAREGARRR